MLFNNHNNCDSKQRFGIRKLSVGVCSVLLSTLFLTMNSPQIVRTAKAATGSRPEENEVEQVQSSSDSGNQTEESATPTDKTDEETVSNTDDSAKTDRIESSATEESETKDQSAQKQTETPDKTSADNTESQTKKSENNKPASEGNEPSDAVNSTQKQEANTQTSTPKVTVPQDSKPITPANDDGKTNDLIVGKDPKTIDPKLIGESKVNTTNTTLNWGNHRYIMHADLTTHPNQYWYDRIIKQVMPWILKENNNEGATFKSWEFTSQGTYNGDNWTPTVDSNQQFSYPSGNLVVTNPNGTTTTTYTGIVTNIGRSIASYFRGKYRVNDHENTVQTPVKDEDSKNTFIIVHANSENPFTHVIPNSSIDMIKVGGWTYGKAAQGENAQTAQQSRDYLLSIIKEIKLTDANISQNGTTYGPFAITFTDDSVLQGNKATLNVVGGVAQTGLTIAKKGDFTSAYPNATSGITSGSQSNIAKWSPTYKWVYDANGTPLDANHKYNTSANFNAYVKINYKQDGKADGFQIVKVPVTIVTLNLKIGGNGNQTETYKDSAYNSSKLDLNKFKPSFINTADNKPITNIIPIPTPTESNRLNASDYTFKQNGTEIINPTNAGRYDVYLNNTGVEKVKHWTNSDLYNWTNQTEVKVGTFTIEKAKPTVTFNGEGSKTYDGSAISNYTTPIGLTIVAPGTTNPSISLTAGTDYVWKKGDTTYKVAPSDAGTYTIELTDSGKAKITGSTINSANLDWANATINTDTSYVINQVNTTVNFEGNNDSSKPTYNGSAVSMPSLDTLKGLVSATNNVTGHNVDFSKLTAADFDWYESENATEAMKSAPINAGTYYIKLNSKGLSDLQTQNPNYNITQGTNLYTFTIDKKALTKITFSGDDGKTYNGQAGSIDATKASNWNATGLVPGQTLNTSGLTNADFSWSKGSVPTNVSDTPASIVLNADGLTKLLSNNSNYTFTKDDVKGKITYTITQANGTVSIKNTTPDNYFKPYDSQPTNSVDMSKLTVTAADGSTSVIDFSTTGLTDADFEFVDAQGNALTKKPTAVGTYSIKLTNAGLTKLNNANPNYKLTYDNSLATYKINPVTLTVEQAGSSNKTYTGSALSPDLSDVLKGLTVTNGLVGNEKLNTSGLTFADFDWTGKTDAGSYELKLNTNGLKKLQDNNKNYTISSIDGKYTFTIDKASATWTLNGNNVTKNYDGKAVTVDDTGMKVTLDYPGIKDADKNFAFTSDDYTITKGNQTVTEMKDAGTYTISLSQAGKDKIAQINSENVTWDGSGSITVTIKKATVKGDAFEGNVTINYGETPNFDNKYTATLVPTDSNTIAGFDANYVVPQGSYLQFKRHGSNEVWSTTVPTTVGTYDVILNADGWNALKDAKNSDNIQLSATGTTFTNNTATFVINPVSTTAIITGSKGKTYDNKTVSSSDLNAVASIKVPKLTDPISYTLVDGDYTWNETPINVGTYTITLTDSGVQHLQKAINDKIGAGNVTIADNGVTNKVSYEITKAVPTATISETASKTYDGSPIANYQPTVSITAPGNNTVSLKAGTDYVWKNTETNVTSSSAPSDAGNYKIQLTTTGETKVKGVNAQNLDWSNVTIGNDTSYVISKRDITVTENGSETANYDGTSYGDKNGLDTSKFVPTLTTTDNVKVPDISGINWDATTDFVVKDADDQTLTADQIKNVGTYKVYLTDAGLNKLKAVEGASNFNWPTSVATAGTFTINSVAASATISSSTGRDYDGKATTSSDLNAVTTITVPGSAAISYTLVDGDYTWNTPNNAAPINASDTAYTITLTNAGIEHLQKAINDKIGAGNVTIDSAKVTNNVSYKINKATATVNFVNGSGQTVDYTGQTGKFDASKFTPTISTNNDQTLSIPSGVNLSLAAGDFTINNVETTTEPTALGTYTIGLSDTGFAKLQSATDNYNWVNKATASYIIKANDQATVTVTNKTDGGQKVVYKNADYGTNDIDINDYQLTLPTGLSYTLQAGDLEIVPNATGTKDVGSYTVQLSQQGKDNLVVAGGNNFKFDFTKPGVANTSATFEITKATPSVTFHGEGSKTFAQNDTNWKTNIGLTINAPGANNPTIALANGDYQFVLNSDHSVTSTIIPTNVGEYTIELTDQGKKKINDAQGTNLNAANLDWANATISGTGTFTIKAAEASAKLSGTNSRDYNGSAVTTTDINKGGNIVVSISIPGTDKTVSYTLQDGDYTWTNGTDPINQGSYTLELNKAKVLAHLQAQIDEDSAWKGNVTIAETALSGEATFTIKKVNASAQLQNGDSRKYNGSSTSISDVLSQLQNGTNWNASGFVNNEKLDTSTLTADGFDWYEADGTTKLTEDPKTVGKYVIKLNSKGISELQNANGNYTFTPNGQFTYEITKASGTVTFSGDHTITFGQSDPDYYKHYSLSFTTDPTISGYNPSYEIKAGNLQFSTDGQNWNDKVPTAKGTYQVRLNPSILATLDNAANIEWSQTGTGTYIINAATATAELSGKNHMTYSGDAATANDVNGGTIEVTLNFPGVTDTNKVFKLTDESYYTWNTVGGKAPKDAGKYTITLTGEGKTALQKYIDGITKGNVTLPSVSGSAEFDIDAKAITVTQSGSGDKTYDGSAANVTVADLTNNNNWSATGMIGGQSFKVPEGMASSDFDWYKVNADGSETKRDTAPTDAGNYALKLNADGLKKLQDANKNYSFTAISGQYNYVINQANAEISLNETTNKQSATWTGSQISLDLNSFVPAIKDTSNGKDISYPTSVALTAGDYTITQNGQAATAKEPGTYQIQLTEQGWQKIRDAISGHDNYKWTYSGNGVLTINKKSQAITISGSNNVIYSGSSAVIPADNDGNLIGYTVNLGNGLTYQLKSGDLAFVDADHTNVGNYKLKLTDAGLENIKKLAEGNHYDYQYTYNADNTATLTVDLATATYALSGSQNSIYNGSQASIDLSKNNSYSITIKMNNGQNVTYQLKTEDLAFKSGSNPTARGKYDVVLSATGLQHLKDINSNYTWDADKSTSTATFEISPAEMHVDLVGEADTVYNGQVQPVPADQLSKLHLVWGGSNDAPTGVTNITINADDFEYVQKQADGSYKVVEPKEHGEYILRLKQSAVDRLNDQNPTANYTFLLGNQSSAKYIINKLPAQITLSKSQTAEYTKAENLDVKNFEVQLTNTADGQPITITNLQPGDLLIDGYKQNEHPTDVGTYKVKIQKQLIDRLKIDYPDYNFDKVTVRDASGKAVEGSVDGKNNDGLYIITAIDAFIKISGDNDSSYYSPDPNHTYPINSSKYHVALTDKFGNSIALPTGFTPKWKFVQNPTDAGQYEVTLDPSSITELEKIGTKNSNGLNNYQWIAQLVPASYEVKKVPVTATVSNKNNEPASSIYGETVDLKGQTGKYSITLVDTQNNQTLTYDGLTAGDLEFVNGTPSDVGTYEVQLSKQGLENIEKKYPLKNYDITSARTATYQIKAATPTVTITANGDSQKTYNAQPAEIKSGDFAISIKTNNGQTINATLNSADLEFDGSAPTNVGQYDVKLKQSAIDQLKHDHPNYDWDVVSVTKAVGKYTITAADGSAVLSGDVTKPYDGSAISDLSPIKVTVDYPGVDSNTTYTLTNDDYVIVNDQTKEQYKPNEAPADVGNYHIELTATGKANIAKLGNTEHKNINWTDKSYTGKATYTITAISISVSGQGNQDVTYNGTAFGNEDKLDLNKFVPSLSAGTDEHPITTPTIPVDLLNDPKYFTIEDDNGENENPTNAGTYKVYLNKQGLEKLASISSNFTWPTDPIKVGTLNIAQTDVTAKLSGSNKKTYDGDPVSTKDINKAGGNIKLQVTVNGKTYDYALQDGDYTWANGEAPTNVGEYTDKIVLDTTGTLKNHLTAFINDQNKDLEGNFKIDATNLTGSASFSITQKEVTVTQKGSDGKIYNGTAGSVTLDQLINNLTSKDLVSGQNLNTSGLTLDDFAWSGTDPNHIAAGDYTIALTSDGIAKLQADNPNYNISLIGSFKYTINQATASAELSGKGQKTYNGDPVSDTDIQKADQDNNITVKVTIPGVKDPQTVTLGVNDFDWNTKDGKAPSVAGAYTITLNAAGKAAINKQFADNKNIDWTKTSFTGSATYTIKKADGTISFTGSDSKEFDNEEVKPSDLDGNKFYATVNGQKVALPESGYEIVDADGKKVTPTDVGTYYVVLTQAGLDALEKDTNYNWKPNWNGTTVDNEIGTFVINQLQADPTISGSNSKQYDGQPVTTVEVTKDGKIKVTVGTNNDKFTIPDYVLTDGDYDWFNTDGSKLASAPSAVGKYVIKLSSKGLQNIQAYLDKTYGNNNISFDQNKYSGQADFEITAKPTQPSEPTNPGQGSDDGGGTTPPAPEPQPTDAKPTKPSDQKPGDKPDHKPSKPGKPDKPNKPGKPEKPNKPSKPNKPNKPNKPSKPSKPAKPSKPSKPSKTEITKPGKHATKAPTRSQYTNAALAEKGEKRNNTNTTSPNSSDVPAGFPAGTHWKNGMLVGPAGEIYYKNGHWTRVGEHVLPQTGAHTNMLATVFGSLASGLGIFGLLGVHKKKKDEEEN